MEKLRYESQYKKLSSEEKRKFKNEIADQIEFEGLSTAHKILMIGGGIFSIIGIILFAVGGISSTMDESGRFGLIVIGLLFGIGGFLSALLIWRSGHRAIHNVLNQQANVLESKLYKKYFEENYSNITTKGTRTDYETVRKLGRHNRGASVPGDAQLLRIRPGFDFKFNESIIHTGWVLWRWYRRSGNTTVEYTQPKLVGAISGVQERMKPLTFSLKPNTIFRKNRTELANKYFSKKWVYENNDPVKIRLLLTPYVQEQLIEKNNWFSKERRGVVFRKNSSNLVQFSFDLSKRDTPFKLNIAKGSKINYRLKGRAMKEHLAEIILRDWEDDSRLVVKLLTNLALFKNLI